MYEGDDGVIATVKASPEDQEALVGGDPQTFGVASHVGRYGWTTIRLARIDADELRELVVEAGRRTVPKRAVAAFDRGRPASPRVRQRESASSTARVRTFDRVGAPAPDALPRTSIA